jgi:hypothetical protein
MDTQAKGCGKAIHISGTNGGMMPCGAMLTQLDGSKAPYFCGACDPTAPAKRTERLYKYFGWQGGTIHQLADETGVDSYTLLYGEVGPTPRRSQGALAIEACTLASRLELAKHVHGDKDYWLGVAGA